MSQMSHVDKAIRGYTFETRREKDANIYTINRKAAITMRVQSNLISAAELPTIDFALMFQRLATVAKSSDVELHMFFKYELCFLLPLLFEPNGLHQ